MSRWKVTFTWKLLYEAKTREVEKSQQRSVQRIKEWYQKEIAKRRSQPIQVCTKVPPSSNKRSFWGSGPGIGLGNTESNLMKKVKLFLNSQEVKNLAALKNQAVQRILSQIYSTKRAGSYSPMGSSSRSNFTSR